MRPSNSVGDLENLPPATVGTEQKARKTRLGVGSFRPTLRIPTLLAPKLSFGTSPSGADAAGLSGGGGVWGGGGVAGQWGGMAGAGSGAGEGSWKRSL